MLANLASRGLNYEQLGSHLSIRDCSAQKRRSDLLHSCSSFVTGAVVGNKTFTFCNIFVLLFQENKCCGLKVGEVG